MRREVVQVKAGGTRVSGRDRWQAQRVKNWQGREPRERWPGVARERQKDSIHAGARANSVKHGAMARRRGKHSRETARQR